MRHEKLKVATIRLTVKYTAARILELYDRRIIPISWQIIEDFLKSKKTEYLSDSNYVQFVVLQKIL